MKLKEAVAIVTGAGQGIGRSIALSLAQEGADVVVADIDPASADAVAGEIRALGRRALASATDVGQSRECELMSEFAVKEFGRIDILVNNAGGRPPGGRALFCDSTEEAWDATLSVNLKGVRNCCRAVIGHMIRQRKGRIVNIASVAGMIGGTRSVDYSAAKAGVIGFTMALAKEVVGYGINVNCVSPGVIESRLSLASSDSPEEMQRIEQLKRMTGFNRMGNPKDIADMVVFLVSDAANFITGQNYAVCGLINLGP